MAANLTNLVITITTNAAQAQQGLRQVQQAVQQTASQVNKSSSQMAGDMEKLRNSIRGVAGELTTMGASLTAALTVPLVAIATMGRNFAVLEQKAMTSFAAMTGGAEQAAALFEQVVGLSNRIGADTGHIVMMTQRLMSVGVAADEATGALEVMANIAAKYRPGDFNEAMQRMTQAISQMASKGKLTAEEMTQQAGEVFNAWEMLSRATGKSQAELQDQSEKGLLDAATYLPLLFREMAKDADGFAEKVGILLPGAFQRLQNAASMAFGELMEPSLLALTDLLNNLTPVIMQVADGFSQMDDSTKMMIVTMGTILAAIGPVTLALAGLTFVIGTLLSPIGLVVTAFAAVALAATVAAAAITQNWGGVRDMLERDLATIANVVTPWISAAADWGYNLIVSFANGMADAVQAIVNVLMEIGNIIAGWLQPGSPPKLLPDIDKWGAGAMSAYMEGWKHADFSVFNEVAAMIEDRLRYVARASGGDLASMIFGSRAALMQAMNDMRQFGEISEETMQQIADSAGDAGGEIQGIIETYIRWVQAGEDVARIQREITQLNKQFAAELRPLESELDKINQAQQDIADQQRIASLAEQVAKGKADPKELALLQQEVALRKQIREIQGRKRDAIEGKEAELEAAEGVRDGLQEQIDAFQDMNKYQKDNVRLMDEFTEKTKGAGGAAKGAAGALKGLGNQIRLGLPNPEELKQKWSDLWKEIETRWNTALKPINDFMARLEKGVEDPFKRIGDSLTVIADEFDRITKMLPGWMTGQGRQGPIEEEGRVSVDATLTKSEQMLQAAADMWAKYVEVKQAEAALYQAIADKNREFLEIEAQLWGHVANFLSPAIEHVAGILRDDFNAAVELAGNLLRNVFLPYLEKAADALFALGQLIETGVTMAMENMKTAFEVFTKLLKGDWTGAFESAAEWVGTMRDKAKEAAGELASLVGAASGAFNALSKLASLQPSNAPAAGGGSSGFGDDTSAGMSGVREWGGPVRRGGSYWVGEHGPELFRPAMPGTIVPNHQITLGGLTINVMPGPAGSDVDRLAAAIWDQATDALRAIVPAAA